MRRRFIVDFAETYLQVRGHDREYPVHLNFIDEDTGELNITVRPQ